jgi:transposase
MVDNKIRSLTGETVKTLYIGVDFHPHQQTVCWCDPSTGEIQSKNLYHNSPELKQFYQEMPSAMIGIEASTNAPWYEALLQDTGHELLVGNPELIRKKATSRHKSDKRDAELIFDLLRKNEFPTLWRREKESTEVLEILKLRQSFVTQRTQSYNRLQALGHAFGLPKSPMKTLAMQTVLKECPATEAQALQRTHLFTALENLNEQIAKLEVWLQQQAKANARVQLLETQTGVGYLTALAVVHGLGDVKRFAKVSKQVAAFVGLEPVEKSSASKTSFGSVSKKGSWIVRYFLGQAGNIAARHDPFLKGFSKRLGKKKKQKAIVKTAVARKLVVKLAIRLRDNITAAEFDRRGRTEGNARTVQGLP